MERRSGLLKAATPTGDVPERWKKLAKIG